MKHPGFKCNPPTIKEADAAAEAEAKRLGIPVTVRIYIDEPTGMMLAERKYKNGETHTSAF